MVITRWVVPTPSNSCILELRRGYFDRPRFWLVRLQLLKKLLDINLSEHTPIEIHISISIYLELQDLTIAGFAHIYICTYNYIYI